MSEVRFILGKVDRESPAPSPDGVEGWLISCQGLGRTFGGEGVPARAYLARYDPEGNGGLGDAAWAYDPAEAMVFASAGAAAECMNAIPRNRPVRPDGGPNRPLSIFMVELVPLPLPLTQSPAEPGDPHSDDRALDDRSRLYGELPPGIGPLMDLASALIHRAFTAHKSGDLASCDAFITEGQHACGGVFQMNAEYVVKFPNHTDDRAWMAFLAHLATRIDPPAPEVSRPPAPPPPKAKPISLAEELRQMGLM